jgi:hypothetical protein
MVLWFGDIIRERVAPIIPLKAVVDQRYTMKRLFPLVLLLLLPGLSYSSAKPSPGFQLTILEMDETGVVLEYRLVDFAMEARQHDGVAFQEISVPGMHPMTEPGQPQLPGLSRLLGTPPGGVSSVQVLRYTGKCPAVPNAYSHLR